MGIRSLKTPPPIVFILLGCLLWFGAKNFSSFFTQEKSLPEIVQAEKSVCN